MTEIIVTDFCEHCGDRIKSWGIFDGNTYWCIDCAYSGGDITGEEYDEFSKKLIPGSKEYFKDAIEAVIYMLKPHMYEDMQIEDDAFALQEAVESVIEELELKLSESPGE